MVKDALLREFTANARQAGAEVKVVAGEKSARDIIRRVLQGSERTRIAAASDALKFVPQELRPALVDAASPRALDAADAGLVRAHHGVAATGTLVHMDAAGNDRLVWTLPPVCLCLLWEKDIVPELERLGRAMARHLAPGEPEFAQVSLVTGPSRTADIENQLSLGVHGPARLIIVCIRSRHEKN